MTTNENVGLVTLKQLVSGKAFEVSVPSTGSSLEEMREASETAHTIWNEIDARFIQNKPRPVVVADDGSTY